MILSKSKDDRNSASLEKLLPHQKEDFKKILKLMSGLPVTARLPLDPPLHEFLPKTDKDIDEVARCWQLVSHKEVKDRISELHEENPMLGA